MPYQGTAKTCMGYGNRDNLSGLRREDILKYRSCRKSFAEENFNKNQKEQMFGLGIAIYGRKKYNGGE